MTSSCRQYDHVSRFHRDKMAALTPILGVIMVGSANPQCGSALKNAITLMSVRMKVRLRNMAPCSLRTEVISRRHRGVGD